MNIFYVYSRIPRLPWKIKIILIYRRGTMLKILSSFLSFHSALCQLLSIQSWVYLVSLPLLLFWTPRWPLRTPSWPPTPLLQLCCYVHSCAYPLWTGLRISQGKGGFASLVDEVPLHVPPVWLHSSYPVAQTPSPFDSWLPLQALILPTPPKFLSPKVLTNSLKVSVFEDCLAQLPYIMD